LIPIEEPVGRRQLLGYLRVVDLMLQRPETLPPPRPLVEIRAEETFFSCLVRMQEADQALGHVVDSTGKTVGFVTSRLLIEALLRREP
jgi:CBS domain containing-hemolysin-like protein